MAFCRKLFTIKKWILFSRNEDSTNINWNMIYIYITSKSTLFHSGVLFLISPLARRLRTSRFSEPTFCPSGGTKTVLKKHSVSQTSYLFTRLILFLRILSLLTLSLLWLLSPLLRLHKSEDCLLNFLRWWTISTWIGFKKIWLVKN